MFIDWSFQITILLHKTKTRWELFLMSNSESGEARWLKDELIAQFSFLGSTGFFQNCFWKALLAISLFVKINEFNHIQHEDFDSNELTVKNAKSSARNVSGRTENSVGPSQQASSRTKPDRTEPNFRAVFGFEPTEAHGTLSNISLKTAFEQHRRRCWH